MLELLTDNRWSEAVVGYVENLEGFILLRPAIRGEELAHLLQILICEARVSKEEHLKLLAVAHDLSEGRDLGLVSGLPDLIGAVGHWASLEWLCVDGVPVDEQVLNWAVIMAQNCRQCLYLAISQSIIGKPK